MSDLPNRIKIRLIQFDQKRAKLYVSLIMKSIDGTCERTGKKIDMYASDFLI